MSKRIRINNDIEINWSVNIQNQEGEYILDLSSLPLGVNLVVGSKEIPVENFTITGNLISFVYRGNEQEYTGPYILKLYDTENKTITYDVINAFILVDHSWNAPDIIVSPTEVSLTSVVTVDRIVTIKGEKGDSGSDIVVATTDTLGGIKIGYTQNGSNYPVKLDVNQRAYVTVTGEGGGGGGGGTVVPRSVLSIDTWFKVSTLASGITSPDLSYPDPQMLEAGAWSLNYVEPSSELPYLWCFLQINYNRETEEGYPYSRTPAYVVRWYNSDSSGEFQELEELITQIREEVENDIDGFEEDLVLVNNALENIRTTLSGTVESQLSSLDSRITSIETTGVTEIDGDALWGKMTSYVNDGTELGIKQKSFSDIVLDAENAKATLQTGSQFFNKELSANLTLNGIDGRINASATKEYVDENFPDKEYVDNQITAAQLEVNPAAVISAVEKGSLCWQKNNILYRYDVHLYDQAEPFTDLGVYETFMGKSPAEGGPSASASGPAGPFEKKVIIAEFSLIKQTVDEISSSVYKTIYMWKKDEHLYGYEDFQTEYDERPIQYQDYTYDEYITHLGYTKVEVSNILTNIVQTSDEIALRVSDMNHIWRKKVGNVYQYSPYVISPNESRETYVARMQRNGWQLYDFTEKFSVIDQTADGITLAAAKGTLCWVKESLEPTDAAYCRDYDFWYTSYQNSGVALAYETWVQQIHTGYQLKKINSSIAELKVQAGKVSSVVSKTDSLETTTTALVQTSEDFHFGVERTRNTWYNRTTHDTKDYDAWESEYELYKERTTNPLEYEAWVASSISGHNGYTRTPISIAGMTVEVNKIWLGVKDDDVDDVSASIEIIAKCATETEEQVRKIILSAAHVIINGDLITGSINSGHITAASLQVIGEALFENITVTGAGYIAEAVTTNLTVEDIARITTAVTTNLTVEDTARITTAVIGDLNATNFFATNISGGSATLTGYLGVKDSSNNIVAMINGSDTGKDNTHGKLMFAAGIPAGFPSSCSNAAFRVYGDGSVYCTKADISGKITANDGSIGGISISNNKLGIDEVTYEGGGATLSGVGISSDYITLSYRNNPYSQYFTAQVGRRNNTVVPQILEVINEENGNGIYVRAKQNCMAIQIGQGMVSGLRPYTRSISYTGGATTAVNFTDSDCIIIMTNSATVTSQLPGSPAIGQTYLVYHASNTSYTLLAAGNKTIKWLAGSTMTSSQSVTSTKYEAMLLTYSGSYWYMTFI